MPQIDPEKPDPINKGGSPETTDKPPSGCTGMLWRHKNKRKSPRDHNGTDSPLQELEQNVPSAIQGPGTTAKAERDANNGIANAASYEVLDSKRSGTAQNPQAGIPKRITPLQAPVPDPPANPQ